MSRKVYEISFAIAGKLGSGFNGPFSYASSRMQQLKSEVQKLNAEYKKGNIGLEQYGEKQQGLARKIRETERAQQLMNRAMQKQQEISRSISRAATGSVRNMMTTGVVGGTLAIGAGGVILGSSVQKAMAYEAQLSSIQALTNITNEELAKMDALALQMGADTKYSALQAAQGIEEMLKAGLSPATIQAGGLEAALNLATAGSLELIDSAEILSDALNGFKKDGMTAADAANILAGAANASSTGVMDLKLGLSAVGPVADGIGVSFKEVNATLAAFSNNMLKSSDAGTSLKTFLANVQPQTKAARELFHDFGLMNKNGENLFFANGQLKDMAEVAEILRKNFGKLNEQQRSDTFFDLFGSDAVRAANTLFKEGAEGIQKMYREMADVTALEVAKKKMDNAAGSVEQFKGALETLQIRALRPLLPHIKEVFKGAGDFVERNTPRIVQAVQTTVDAAESYLRTNYINNPDFQKLDKQGKITFVFENLWEAFDKWYAASGNKYVTDLSAKLTAGVASGLETNIGPITSAALKIGGSIASGMWDGIQAELAKNPTLSLIIGGIVGSKTPGPIPVKAASAAATTASLYGSTPAVKEYIARLDSPEYHAQRDKEFLSQGIAGIPPYVASKIGDFPPYLYNKMKSLVYGDPEEHAEGGIFSTPHYGVFAEAGPEAFIPIDGSPRAKSIWRETGEKLGMGSGGAMHFTFAPVIHGTSKEEAREMLQEQQRSFVDQMKGLMHQNRRVSFNE